MTYRIPQLQVHSNKTAVIVEGTVESSFAFCVPNVLHYLGEGWALKVYHTEYNSIFVHEVLKDIANINYVLISQSLGSIADYNKLLKSPEFWRNVDSDRILFFQSDSIIIKKNISKFIDFDFIGAPWDFDNNRIAIELRELGVIPTGVGNGGFGFRNGRAMEAIADKFGKYSPEEENEDVFFARHMIKNKEYKLPNRSVAYSFCLEAPLSDIKGVNEHYALHAAWYYGGTPDKIRQLILSSELFKDEI